jgi:diaminopimelate epimerase
MTKIPFTKAHGAHNDFLLTWSDEAPADHLDEIARQICDRHTGIGADGWMLMARPAAGAREHVAITLYNSDGSRSEISGNGTRCVAALMAHLGLASGEVRVLTGAGLKRLRVIEAEGCRYEFEMGMGQAHYNDKDLRRSLALDDNPFDVTILNVGNPQCAVFVDGFDFDWRRTGAAIERHDWFPQRTNVSFVRVLDRNTIDVRFWERGAGETMSSGTGSTGAAFAAILRGLAESPVRIITPAGALDFRLQGDAGFLVGPAELIGAGEYYLR